MHLAEMARAGKSTDLRGSEEEEESSQTEEESAPKGLPGFGALHTLIADANLKSVKVTHVRNLAPAKLKGLKGAVDKMHFAVGETHDPVGAARTSKPAIPIAPPKDEMGTQEVPAPPATAAHPRSHSVSDDRARRARDAAVAASAAVAATPIKQAATGSREAIHLKFREKMMNHSVEMNKALEETIREKQAASREEERLRKRAEEVTAKMKEAEDAARQPESVHTMVARNERLSEEHRQASLKVSREDARRKVLEYREAQRARRERLGAEVTAREEAANKVEGEAAERAETEASKPPHAGHSGLPAMTQSLGVVAFAIATSVFVS